MKVTSYVSPDNRPKAKKILKKKGLWGKIINKAIEDYKL